MKPERRLSELAWDAVGVLVCLSFGTWLLGFGRVAACLAGTCAVAAVICLVSCVEVVE